jgi:hypothetical protein
MLHKIRSFAIAFFLAPAALHALTLSAPIDYYPDSFYKDVENGVHDGALKSELFDILSRAHLKTEAHDRLTEHCAANSSCYQHFALGYNRARHILFGQLHLVQTPEGWGILDVYCRKMTTAKDYPKQPPAPGQIPDPTVMNTEHTWPQSKFSKAFNKNLQKSDLHILFPVLENANSSRSNLEYGDVVTPTSSPCPGAERGYTASGDHEPRFEPPDPQKGNAARAIFYFSVRYKLHVSPEEESSLKAWNRLDPVDDAERTRNESIFEAQKDRNPFIDYPELVELISDF